MPISLINTNALGAVAATVSKGGTGLGTLTSNNLLAGDGTNVAKLIAPGAAGQVLTSNGTNWAPANVPTPTSIASGTGANQWTISFSGTKVFFAYNGSNVVSIDSAGNISTLANVTGAAASV